MIVRSRIRQSFRRPWGFVLEKGDNTFATPLPDPVMHIFETLRRAKLVEFIDEQAVAVEQTPWLAPTPIGEGPIAAHAPRSRPSPKRTRKRQAAT